MIPSGIPSPRDIRRIDLPQSPTDDSLGRTLEHLTGRPADQREIGNVMQRLDRPQRDYAPGGETSNRLPTVLR